MFTTLRANKDGPIVEVRQSKGNGTRFKVISGANDRQTGQVRGAHLSGGAIPKGTWFIAKWANAPKVIRRKATSDRVGALTGEALLREFKRKSYWMALYRDDSDIGQPIDDETYVQGQVRNGIRAHFGSYSLGCLTFQDKDQYFKFIQALSKQPPTFINAQGQPVEKGTKHAIEVYGKLIVGDAIVDQAPVDNVVDRLLNWFQ